MSCENQSTVKKTHILTSNGVATALFDPSWCMLVYFLENKRVLCDFPVNPSVLHVPDLMGLCAG